MMLQWLLLLEKNVIKCHNNLLCFYLIHIKRTIHLRKCLIAGHFIVQTVPGLYDSVAIDKMIWETPQHALGYISPGAISGQLFPFCHCLLFSMTAVACQQNNKSLTIMHCCYFE